ncbi:MAG: DEAD/DEAH box helicase family protein [Streptococcus thermophilus]
MSSAYTDLEKLPCLILISGTLQIISQNKESFLSFILVDADLADCYARVYETWLESKRINRPQELNEKHDDYQVVVVNIQKFKIIRFNRSFGYDLNRQNIYFIDEAHRSYNEKGSYLPNLQCR